MSKKDKHQNQPEPPRKKPKIFYIGAVLVAVLLLELLGIIVYKITFDKRKDLFFQAFLGLSKGYDPNKVSNYLPHHYMIYVLNPKASFNYKTYYGEVPNHFINSLGYRGAEFTVEKPNGVFRIAAIGGSTTFCLTEPDETKTYPRLLQDTLNKMAGKKAFEVINAGTPGWSTAESLINLHFRLLEFEPDMIIVYHGVNDTFIMRRDNEGNADNSNFRQPIEYKVPPDWMTPFFKFSKLARLFWYHTNGYSTDINGLARKPPGKMDMDKNLKNATGKYFRRNMEGIVNLALSRNIIPVLVTQGHGGWHGSIGLVNNITRSIAKEKRVPLVDFEPLSQPQFFSGDRIHMTYPGNQARTQAILNQILKVPKVQSHLQRAKSS